MMQDRSVSGMEHDRKEMIALLNSGDKRELRAFMQLYSKKIYDRALDITDDADAAKNMTRQVLAKVAELAQQGALKENIDLQLMTLTDSICSAPVFAEPLPLPPEPEAAEAEPVQVPSVQVPSVQVPSVQAAPVQDEPAPAEPVQAEPVHAEPVQAAPAEPVSAAPAPVPAEPMRPAAVQAAPSNSKAVPLLFDDEDELPQRRAPLPEAEEERGASPLLVIGIILLSLVVVFLVWVLVVKMMTTGIIPNYDFGFARWFDSHVFEFYY